MGGMSRLVGIDLGTSNTVTAVCVGHTPTVIPNAEGERFTPSIVGIDAATGRVLVGSAAKRQATLNPRGTVFSVKRLMGKTFDQVQHELPHFPYEVVRGANGDAHIRVGKQTFSPADISALVLRKAKEDAESFLQEDVTKAVITVPAYFNDRQRKATQIAGQLAGLNVLRIINEPTAAALAYCLARPKEDCRIAVVHLGGGTLDISILDVGNGVFEVKSVCGDTHLGGDDFDQCIIDWSSDELRRTHGIDPSRDSTLAEMLKWEAERAKCDLSTLNAAELVFPYVRVGSSSEYTTASLSLARSVFEEKAKALIERISGPCKMALKDAYLSSVDHVILVGQQTRMPAVQHAVEHAFGRPPRRDIDPAEVVAMGAAVQTEVLKGEIRDVLLLDVIPITLGIETLGGVFAPLIERNTTIPTLKSEIFSTASDNQSDVKVEVYQGERKLVGDNTHIGTFTLDRIPPAPRGLPQIEVTFEIDANGGLYVSAKDLGTGREQGVSFGGTRMKRTSFADTQSQERKANAPTPPPEQPATPQNATAKSPSVVSRLRSLFGRGGKAPKQ